MDKGRGVTLPIVLSLTVEGYGLFKQDWSYRVGPGLNVFLGVNGVGKTTTIRAIAFAILGRLALDHKRDYFASRVPAEGLSPEAFVEITFLVGATTVTVRRNLLNLTLVKVTITDENGVRSILNDGTFDAEKSYAEMVTSLIGIPTMQDLNFLLDHLIIREEEADAVLWNAGNQARVLRLLFQEFDFEREFRTLQSEVKDWHIQLSNAAKNVTITRNSLSDLEKQFDHSTGDTGTLSPSNLATLTSLRVKREEMLNWVSDLKSDLTTLMEHKSRLQGQLFAVEEELDAVEANLAEQEARFHARAHENYDVFSVALRKLERYSTCSFCDQPSQDPNRVAELRTLITSGKCAFCGQTREQHIDGDIDLGAIEELHSQTKRLRGTAVTHRQELGKLEADIQALTATIAAREEPIRNLSQEITRLELKTSTMDISDGEPGSQVLLDRITTLRRQLELQEKAEEATRRALADALKRVAPLRQRAVRRAEELREQFQHHFSLAVEQYLGESCQVRVDVVKDPGNRAEYAVYVPVLGGKERPTARHVSKSQAVLLDYAFRMAVLELYRELSGLAASLIIESSEGVLDVGYVTRVGALLSKFGMKGHHFVVVSNITRADFLTSLYAAVPEDERRCRTLNFLEFGRLSPIQQESVKDYDRIVRAVSGIGLPPI